MVAWMLRGEEDDDLFSFFVLAKVGWELDEDTENDARVFLRKLQAENFV